eukprot:1160660-Pelagomonas_calceolata.AAC.2
MCPRLRAAGEEGALESTLAAAIVAHLELRQECLFPMQQAFHYLLFFSGQKTTPCIYGGTRHQKGQGKETSRDKGILRISGT